MGETPGWVPGGWRNVETHIDTIEGMVRIMVIDCMSGKVVFSTRYHPETAREMAYNLTIKALELEDG